MLQADGSLQLSQTFFRSIRFGSFMKIALRVLVMGLSSAQAILRNVADAASFNCGVYAMIDSPFLLIGLFYERDAPSTA
jgi:hypothetical protein